jgi:hypothetical protein
MAFSQMPLGDHHTRQFPQHPCWIPPSNLSGIARVHWLTLTGFRLLHSHSVAASARRSMRAEA